MSILVVGKRQGDGWGLEVQGHGTTSAADLPGIEPAVRALLAEQGVADAETVDLQLLMPDFEVDLSQSGPPHPKVPVAAMVSGVIALLVVVGVVVGVVVAVVG